MQDPGFEGSWLQAGDWVRGKLRIRVGVRVRRVRRRVVVVVGVVVGRCMVGLEGGCGEMTGVV